MRRLLTAVVLCAVLPVVLLVGPRRRRRRLRLHGARDLRQRRRRGAGRGREGGRRQGRRDRVDGRDRRQEGRRGPAHRRRPLHAVPQGREVRRPPAVADRREVRGVRAGHRRRARSSRRSRTATARASTCCRWRAPARPSTSTSINNILRRPYAERFSILLSEFGTGLAGRGKELNEVISRANPALKETDRVLAVLARQNRVLANLARDSDAALAPLAREKEAVSDFIVQANRTGEATAERRADIERGIERLPRFLRELRPLMADLGGFAGQAAPVARDLNKSGRGREPPDPGARARSRPPPRPRSPASATPSRPAGPRCSARGPLIQDLGVVRRARAAALEGPRRSSRRASTRPAASSARWTSSSSR